MKAKTKAKIVLALVGAIFLANMTASAAVTIPGTRSTSPGANYHWGIEWNATNFPDQGASVPARSFTGAGYDYGGWNAAPEVYAIGSNNNPPTTPVNVVLSEPYNSFNGQLTSRWYSLGYNDPRAGAHNPQWKYGTQNAAGVATGKVYCSTTEWALSSSFSIKASTGQGSGNLSPNSNNGITFWGSTGYNWASNCKYIQAIVTNLCVYATEAATVYTCTEYTWTAERAFAHSPYRWSAPNSGLCTTPAGSAVSIDCQFVTGVSDPTDFNQVCVKNAPTAAWLDFSWFPAVFSYYGECLFNPKGGFDRNADIADAIADGEGANYVEAFETAADSVTVLESCGAILDASAVPGLDGFVIDTCAWTWASPIKTFLSIAIVAASAASVLVFLFGLIARMFGTHSPMAASENED